MKYMAIKKEVQKRHEALLDECGVFWAFSNEQFKESAPDKSVTLVNIGMGGYMPKEHHARLLDGMNEIAKYEKQAIKKAKADEVILYELNNYECFYTGDISDALEVLEPLGYRKNQVLDVYRTHQAVYG